MTTCAQTTRGLVGGLGWGNSRQMEGQEGCSQEWSGSGGAPWGRGLQVTESLPGLLTLILQAAWEAQVWGGISLYSLLAGLGRGWGLVMLKGKEAGGLHGLAAQKDLV